MELGTRVIDDAETERVQLRERVAELSLAGTSVLISGPSGTGRSFMMRAVEEALEKKQRRTVYVTLPDPEALKQVASTPRQAVLLIDGIENVSPEIADALDDRHRKGGPTVASLDTSSTAGPHTQRLSALLQEASASHDTPRNFERVPLDPLSNHAIELLLHERSATPLDCVTVDSIVEASLGRPAWAFDLLTLVNDKAFTSAPYPVVTALLFSHLHLPALHSLAQTLSPLTSREASIAVALSEIEPLSIMGARALVGSEVIGSLLDSGAFVQHRDTDSYFVPVFVAAALRPRTTHELTDEARRSIAEHLVSQESLGLPLTERDAYFCARAIDPRDKANELVLAATGAVVLRAVTNLVTFGDENQVRALLLRFAASGEQLAMLTRARTLAIFGNLLESRKALGQIHHEGRIALQLSTEFLAAQLDHSQVPVTTLLATRNAETSSGKLSDSEFVFALWNSLDSLAEAAPALEQIVQDTPHRETAIAAQALLDLREVWAGRQPSAQSWLRTQTAIPRLTTESPKTLTDVLGATLVAQALTTFLAGEAPLRSQALFDAAENLPARAYHRLWMMHLVETSHAMMVGDGARAVIEWSLFEQRIPRLLPHRLKRYIQRIGEGLRSTVEPDAAQIKTDTLLRSHPYQLQLHLSGLSNKPLRSPDRPTPTHDLLPLVRLANQHLKAAEDRNPAELLRVADKFESMRLWLPSARATSHARAIYAGRRATGSVTRCDQRLRSLETQIQLSTPWYQDHHKIFSSQTQLTPRELATAKLAAKGLSNREIASEFGCKRRTVESHLAQARAKLGAASRLELADLLDLDD